jgi:hypothetical protein
MDIKVPFPTTTSPLVLIDFDRDCSARPVFPPSRVSASYRLRDLELWSNSPEAGPCKRKQRCYRCDRSFRLQRKFTYRIDKVNHHGTKVKHTLVFGVQKWKDYAVVFINTFPQQQRRHGALYRTQCQQSTPAISVSSLPKS